MKLIKWRKTTEREKDIIGLLQACLGVLFFTAWGIYDLQNGRVPYTLHYGFLPY